MEQLRQSKMVSSDKIYMNPQATNTTSTFGGTADNLHVVKREDALTQHHNEDNTEGMIDFQGDIAPLPLTSNPMNGLQSNIDRQVLDDLYRSLSLPDSGVQNMFGSQMRTGGNVFGLPATNMGYAQFGNPTIDQSNGFAYPSISQDYGVPSQLSSEQLMNSLYAQNMGMMSSMQIHKNAQNYQSVPLVPPEPKKPVKALSAYNFFFRDERDRILNGGTEDYSSEKEEKLLSGHWFRDRTKKRRHRKTHGKITFTTLSRMVSQKWKSLPDDHKSFYKQVAAKDLERYRREVSEIEQGKATPTRSPIQSSVFTARTA